MLLASCTEYQDDNELCDRFLEINLGSCSQTIAGVSSIDDEIKKFHCFVHDGENIIYDWNEKDFSETPGEKNKFRRNLSEEEKNNINNQQLYFVANIDLSELAKSELTISKLKKHEIHTDFEKQINDEGKSIVKPLIMRSDSLYKVENSYTFNPKMVRLASKIEVGVLNKEFTYEGKEGYISFEKMRVRLVGGNSKTILDGNQEVKKIFSTKWAAYTGTKSMSFMRKSDDGKCQKVEDKYHVTSPFYTYASTWDKNVNDEMYLLIELPVKWNGSEKPRYYKVFVDDKLKRLKSNINCQIGVRISMPGADNSADAAEVEAECTSIKFGEISNIVGDIEPLDFLSVEKKEYKLYNEDEGYIKYVASSECEIAEGSIQVKAIDLNNEDDYSSIPKDISDITILKDIIEKDKDNYKFSVELGKASNEGTVGEQKVGFIKYRHEFLDKYRRIENSPYTVSFTIQLKSNPSIKQDVVIVQYPSRYVEPQTNSNYNKDNDKKGYVYIAGQSQKGEYDPYNPVCDLYFCSVAGLTGTNTNPNMYIVNVSDISEDDKIDKNTMVIGDVTTRSHGIIQLIEQNSMYRNTIIGDTSEGAIEYPEGDNYKKGLPKIYWKAREDKAARYMVAPKFRVASSYGVTYPLPLNYAKLRCASYQEDGYPAGRWRLPTYAEVCYIMKLSATGVIPRLFGDESEAITEYWVAGGIAVVNNKSEINTDNENGWDVYFKPLESVSFDHEAPVRCVYDEWYYGDDVTKKDIFTWAGGRFIMTKNLYKNRK